MNTTLMKAELASIVTLLTVTACNQKKVDPPLAPQERSQAVQATGPAATAPTLAPTGAASVPAPAEQPRRVLCAQQLGKPAKDVPKAKISRAGQTDALPEKLPVGPDHWTWVNLWAAWCAPCKEEIPRLKSWEANSAGERVPLKVAFVSIDDDGRQLETFLGGEPANGLHATYWLHDGQERLAWLKEAGMDSEPELPEHLLVDPTGKVRCKQQGAIEDADYVEVLKILRGQRGGAGAGHGGDEKHGYAH